jgi:hypothetical protein
MPRKKTIKNSPVKEVKEELAVKTEECQPPKKEELAYAYSVYNKFNQFVRQYTIEIHKEKRLELAKEFAKKIGGTIKEN